MKKEDAVHQGVRSVGMLGLGKMGLPMARHLVGRGFAVSGFDPRPEARRAAAEVGVEAAESCAEVAARSDFAIVIVGFDREVEDILFGAGRMVEAAKPGLVIGVASTVAPSLMRKLPKRAGGARVSFMDLPICRGESAAENGQLLTFVGGSEADYARCRAAIDSFSELSIRLGDLGAGQVGKAANNMLLWACLTATVESLDWGEALGVDREALRAALVHSSGDNWAMRTRADDRPALWAEKDMGIVLSEADRARVVMPVMGVVKEAIKGFKIARGLPMPEIED